MKLIYIISPFRAKNSWSVEQNIRQAEESAIDIAGIFRGMAVPVCVHSMYRYFNGTVTDKYWLDATMEILKKCDAAYVAGDTRGSEGCMSEIQYCEKTGKPFFYDIEHLDGWLRQFYPE